MAWRFAPETDGASNGSFEPRIALDQLPEEMLVPMLAGAHARGLADAFSLFDISAVFLDGHGRVLATSRRDHATIGGGLTIRAQHLVAEAADDNRLLAQLVADTLRSEQSAVRSARLDSAHVTVHAVQYRARSIAAGQVVRAIFLIDDAREPLAHALAERIAGANVAGF